MSTHGLFITGTDTGVGKTLATACLTALLTESGINAIPYKPVQSGGIATGAGLLAEDVLFYQDVCDLPHTQSQLCSYCLEPAFSPHLAARETGVHIDPARIRAQFHQLTRSHDVVLVEGAGGLAVPIAETDSGLYMTIDLVRELRLPLLLVTHAGLGTINHTVLTVEYARSHQLTIIGLLINRMPDVPTIMQQDNIRMIEKLTGIPVLGIIPELTDASPFGVRQAWSDLTRHIKIETILQKIKAE
ncbi:dethiobiotin synthase [Aneurinibacillus soli]|uniref:ATP-dependent dethiobiotin synthetase BioD n=1 Tax=Aneurinibacillus soli TaxID=1500254 RepID=A0A0U5BB08_9BACL|nr:dethiobiotin synthase [Aneurinibacillus soli]PYE63120.1 dethiobiotin synthase [Aneurinibacillus soli]BAU28822.1 ATP-dependent dethiobiotin synthetase BioD [Aneurinibacillus soli]